jgi:hypothetical protein
LGIIIVPDDIPFYLSEAVPLALDNLDLVLCRELDRFIDRYFDVDRDPVKGSSREENLILESTRFAIRKHMQN